MAVPLASAIWFYLLFVCCFIVRSVFSMCVSEGGEGGCFVVSVWPMSGVWLFPIKNFTLCAVSRYSYRFFRSVWVHIVRDGFLFVKPHFVVFIGKYLNSLEFICLLNTTQCKTTACGKNVGWKDEQQLSYATTYIHMYISICVNRTSTLICKYERRASQYVKETHHIHFRLQTRIKMRIYIIHPLNHLSYHFVLSAWDTSRAWDLNASTDSSVDECRYARSWFLMYGHCFTISNSCVWKRHLFDLMCISRSTVAINGTAANRRPFISRCFK